MKIAIRFLISFGEYIGGGEKHMKNLKDERIGVIKQNTIGDYMKVVEYNGSQDVTVMFLDEHHSIVKTTWRYFNDGTVTNPYGRYLYGKGIVGVLPIRNENGGLSIEYVTWSGMLRRCYNNKGRNRDETYLNCTVSDEWLSFENFSEWMKEQENYNKWILLSSKALDKDILVKGNKIYGKDKCCLVPSYVNNLFTKRDKSRGKYCIGVSFHKRDKLFTATCHNPFTNKSEFLGYFTNEEDAFYAYKTRKETIINMVAEKEYKIGSITEECYNAMIAYQVEITD